MRSFPDSLRSPGMIRFSLAGSAKRFHTNYVRFLDERCSPLRYGQQAVVRFSFSHITIISTVMTAR